MKRLVYSDTDYFYRTFQKTVYGADRLEIITDYQSPSQMPEQARHLLRLGGGKPNSKFEAVTGPILNIRYGVTVGYDRYKRLKIVISS